LHPKRKFWSVVFRAVALRRISKMTPYIRYGVRCIVAFTVLYGMSKSTVPNRTVRSHRTGYMFTCMRHQKQVILQVIPNNTFISLTSSHRWTSPAPLQSAREWAWGKAPFPPPEPAPRASTPSQHPSRSTLPAPRASSLLRWLLAAVRSRCRRTQV
jgi:hypothetical protein